MAGHLRRGGNVGGASDPVPHGQSSRPSARWRRTAIAVAAITMALSFAACTMPDLSTRLSRDDGDTTGAIAGAMFGIPSNITATDLAAARAAASVVLDSNDGKASETWDNPLTGAHGTVTPVAATYVDSNAECHDFLSSYRRDAAEAWLQGEACRNNNGIWEVHSIRAWQRP